MRIFMLFLFCMFSSTIKAQSYRDIIQNNPNSWATRVSVDSAAVFETPEIGTPSMYLKKNMSMLVYDSTGSYYKIARPPVGFIGYIAMKDVMPVTSKSMVVQPLPPSGISSTGIPNKNQNIRIKWGNLATAIGLGFVAFDYLSTASDIQDAIDVAKSADLDTGELEDQKSRKQLVGYALLAGAIVNGIFSFEKVEVNATQNSVALSYAIPIGN